MQTNKYQASSRPRVTLQPVIVIAAFLLLAGSSAIADEVGKVVEPPEQVAQASLQNLQALLAGIDRDVAAALKAVNLAIEASSDRFDPYERQSVPGGMGGL